MKFFFEDRVSIRRNYSSFGISIHDNISYQAHWHPEFELAYVEAGSLWVGINNNRQKLAAGDLAISVSGDIHFYDSTDLDSRIILLIFKPEFFGLAADWPDTRQFAASFFKKHEVHDQIRAALYSLLDENQNKHDYYELFIRAKVIELCAALLRFLPSYPGVKEHKNSVSNLELLQEVLMYIENNFSEEITLEMLSKRFKVDPFNLSKAFNSVTGKNLRTYINTLRVAKAQSLIQTTNQPIINIAFECGFNSIRSFNRAYKRLTGQSPSATRSEVSQKRQK